MTGIIPLAVGLLVIKKLMGDSNTYPHTMYDCNGATVEITNLEEHKRYTEGGWVHDLSECSIDTIIGRDYGEYDYEDSVDDMSDTPYIWTNMWESTDQSGSKVVIWRKQRLTYDPTSRKGFYTEGVYQIGNESKQGWNYDGDRIRTFTKLQQAIDYYVSISTVGTSEGTGGIPDDFDPEVFPEDTPEDIPEEPEDTPLDPYIPPSGGFGQGGYNDGMSYGGMPNTNFGGGY